MKETIKINLAGVAFNIDLDAYEELKKYLNGISAKFNDSEERIEIIQDIEIRISEILQDKLGKNREVVVLDDVIGVIQIMGKPEDYEDQAELNNTNPQSNRQRRIYRNPDNAILGGVSSGIGAYFDVDPIVFRVLFIVMCIPYGIGLLLYIVLWAALPKAISTVQKIEMKGEKITIDNIEKNVKKEFNVVKENLSNYSKTGEFKNHKKSLDGFFHGIGRIILFFVKFIVGIFAFALIFAGLAGIIALLSALFIDVGILSTNFWGLESLSFDFVNHLLGDRSNLILLIIAFIILVGIPMIMLIFAGFHLIFNFKTRLKWLGGLMFFVWFISLFVLLFSGAVEARQFTAESKSIESIDLDLMPDETLYLNINSNEEKDDYISDHVVFETEEYGIYWDNENIWGKAELDIYQSDDGQAQLIIEKYARASTKYKAKKLSKDIIYRVKTIDNHLYFNNYFELDNDDEWRAQHVKIKLYLPEGTTVYIGEDLENILDRFPTKEYYSNKYIKSTFWEMDRKGFVEVEN